MLTYPPGLHPPDGDEEDSMREPREIKGRKATGLH